MIPSLRVQPQLQPFYKSKKILPPLAGILVILFVVLVAFYFRYFKPALLPPSLPTLTPVKPDRVEILPEKYQQTPQVLEYDIMGKQYTKVDAIIKKIIQNRKLYLLDLDNKKTITGLITNKTVLSDAYFDIDKNQNIIQVLYRPISTEKLDNLKIGEKVRLVYLQNNFSTTTNVPLVEFVLLESKN